MLRLRPAPEPPTFHDKVRIPGMRALEELCGRDSGRRGPKRKKLADQIRSLPRDIEFPDCWTACISDLYSAYQQICAYSCMKIHRIASPQVDHYIAKSKAIPSLAYEWCNFRLCSPLMNTCKREFPDVLDPMQIGVDWFWIDFSDFRIVPAEHLDLSTHQQVDATITRLRLNGACLEDREGYYNQYHPSPDPLTNTCDPPLPFELLMQSAPFLGVELLRQPVYLRAEDRARLIALQDRYRSLIGGR